MAWIRSDQDYVNHPAVLFLMARLRLSKAAVLGHLHLLWYWSVDFAPNGDLKSFNSETISGASEYFGNHKKFLQALKDSGILTEQGHLALWDDISGKLIYVRASGNERQKRFREKHASETKNGSAAEPCNADVTRYGPVTDPLPNADVTVSNALVTRLKESPRARQNVDGYKDKDEYREGASPSPPNRTSKEAHIPSLEECLFWAQSSGVDPEWTRKKFVYTDGTHGWVKNKKLIAWQRLWKEWFETDKADGKWAPPKTADKNEAPRKLWEIEQEMKILSVAIEEHPVNNRSMGEAFTPEVEAEYKALLEKVNKLEAEKKAAMK